MGAGQSSTGTIALAGGASEPVTSPGACAIYSSRLPTSFRIISVTILMRLRIDLRAGDMIIRRSLAASTVKRAGAVAMDATPGLRRSGRSVRRRTWCTTMVGASIPASCVSSGATLTPKRRDPRGPARARALIDRGAARRPGARARPAMSVGSRDGQAAGARSLQSTARSVRPSIGGQGRPTSGRRLCLDGLWPASLARCEDAYSLKDAASSEGR